MPRYTNFYDRNGDPFVDDLHPKYDDSNGLLRVAYNKHQIVMDGHPLLN